VIGRNIFEIYLGEPELGIRSTATREVPFLDERARSKGPNGSSKDHTWRMIERESCHYR